jgi:DNA-binding beta-propeller fold protein YncE
MSTFSGKVRHSRFLLAAALVGAPSVMAQPSLAGDSTGDVYVLSNQASGNSVIVFHRDAMGMLRSAASFASGGDGAGSGADPLGSENPLVLSANGKLLFAVNAGSDSITAFQVSGDQLAVLDTVSSGGITPVSLAVRGHLLYVLNAGGTPNISGFIIDPKTGELVALKNSTQPLPGGSSAGPAEVAFSPDENVLVATETGTNNIDTFVLNAKGAAQSGAAFASSEPTPFGFAFGSGHGVSVVSDAEGGNSGASAVSS